MQVWSFNFTTQAICNSIQLLRSIETCNRKRTRTQWIHHTWRHFPKISPTISHHNPLLFSPPFLNVLQLSNVPLLRSSSFYDVVFSFHFVLTVIHCRSSSEKYAPLDWSNYFDKEDDVAIPESNDVSLQNQYHARLWFMI